MPIFSSALAQTQQTQTLLEMQALRDEVAQLRDMVERQGRTLRVLQRQLDQGQTDPRALDAPPSADSGTFDSASSTTQAPNNFPQQADVYTGTQAPGPSSLEPFATANGQQGNSAYGQPLPAQPQVDGAQRPQANGDFYRPEPSTENPTDEVSLAQQRANDASALPAAQDDGFPPVVDRSIGGARTGQQGVSQQTPAYQGNSQSLPQQQVPPADLPSYQQPATDQGLSTRSLEPFNRAPASSLPATDATTGVVAVPSVPQVNPQTPAAQNPADATLARAPIEQAAEQTAASGSQLSEDEMYNQGFELLKQSKFEEASAVFEQQIKAHPQGNLADDAHYWISEAMTMVSNTEAARTNLRAIVDNYPQSSRVPDARLRLAYIEERKGNLIEARILLQEVVNNYPQSDAAIAAKNRLETLQ